MFSKGLLGYLPANIIQGVVGFLALSVFTRLLSPDDYGRYALAFGVSSLAQTAFFTWLEAAMARFYIAESQDDAGAPKLYGTVYRTFALISAGFVAVLGLVALIWRPTDANLAALKLALLLGLAAVVFRSALKLVQEQRRAEGRVAVASFLDMAQTIGGFLIGVGLIYFGLGGGGIVLAAGLMAAISLPFVMAEDVGRARKGHFDPLALKSYAAYGLPVAGSLILTLALFTLDRFLISYFLSEADAGAYHAGFSLASRILDVLFIWLGAAGGPAMVHALETQGEDGLKAQARTQVLTMAMIVFPAVTGLIVVAPALAQILIGEGLRDRALLVTPFIAAGALMSGFTTYYALQSFTLAKKTKLLMAAMAIPALSNLVLNLILIPRFGLLGAGWAATISFGLGLVGAILLGQRAIKLPLPLLELTKIGAAAGLMAFVVSRLPAWGGIAELATKATLGAIIYGFLAYYFNLGGAKAFIATLYQRFSPKMAA